MAIQFNCPVCKKALEATDALEGKQAACPGCGENITVPQPVKQ